MRCNKCRTMNAKSSKFCYLCGTELPVDDEAKALVNPINMDNDEETSTPFNPTENELNIVNGEPTAIREAASMKAADEPQSLQIATSNNLRLPKGVRIILALLACFGIFFVYGMIGVIFGWKHGGGFIPMLIVFSLVGVTWRAITGQKR